MARDESGIRIILITGSVRPANYTGKAAALVIDELQQQTGVTAQLIDPRELELHLPGVTGDSSHAERLRSDVEAATGVILATPEYHGSYSAATKLVIENLGFPSVLAGKPVALLGVAAGTIGALKALEHLRSVCSHVGAIVLPGPVSVAGVQQVFDEQGRCRDEQVEKRIRGVATNLLHYIQESVCPRVALERMVREGTG